jgi:hypothetical protein
MLIGAQVLGFSRGGCVLDVLSSGVPEAAYSLRRLTASYKGKCINVRRSSDNAAMDIGFIGNSLDTVTLGAFCGSSSGYVTKWYNQGNLGSSGDFTQSNGAFQPRIVNAGTLEVANGKPTLNFGYTGTCFLNIPASINPTGTTPNTINVVGTYATGYNSFIVLWSVGTWSSTAGQGRLIICNIASPNLGMSVSGNGGNIAAGTLTNGQSIIFTAIFASTGYLFLNGAQQGSSTAMTFNTVANSNNRLGQGNQQGSDYWKGTIQEVVQPFVALSSADRQTLEHNQESFYGISGS